MKLMNLFAATTLAVAASASVAEHAPGTSGKQGNAAGVTVVMAKSNPDAGTAQSGAGPANPPAAAQAATDNAPSGGSERYALMVAAVAAIGFMAYRRKGS